MLLSNISRINMQSLRRRFDGEGSRTDGLPNSKFLSMASRDICPPHSIVHGCTDLGGPLTHSPPIISPIFCTPVKFSAGSRTRVRYQSSKIASCFSVWETGRWRQAEGGIAVPTLRDEKNSLGSKFGILSLMYALIL
jgi:hypothetical protein